MNTPAPQPSILRWFARWLTLLALMAGLAYAATWTWNHVVWSTLHPRGSPEREVFQLLRSETLSFLVTERLTSQITVEVDESSLWLGSRRGTLTGTVRMYYGIDLSQLTPDAVRHEAGVCVVTIPEPTILDFAVDVASLTFRTQRSLLQVIGDRFRDFDLRFDLQSRFRTASESFFREQQLLPDRTTLCARLNDHAKSWSAELGVEVRFQ